MNREIGLRTTSGAETENLIGPAMRHKILTALGYVGTLVEGVKIAVGSWAAMPNGIMITLCRPHLVLSFEGLSHYAYGSCI
jgi:hypothetical protein